MKRLLWIDDQIDLVERSRPLFEDEGFLLFKARNVSEALSVLRTEKLDGVLLDVQLGTENGLALLAEIRGMYPNLHVVIFTGYPEYDDQAEALMSGARAYLHKIDKELPATKDGQRRFFTALRTLLTEKPQNGHPDQAERKESDDVGGRYWHPVLALCLLLAVVFAGIAIITRNAGAQVIIPALTSVLLVFGLGGLLLMRTRADPRIGEKSFERLFMLTVTKQKSSGAVPKGKGRKAASKKGK